MWKDKMNTHSDIDDSESEGEIEKGFHKADVVGCGQISQVLKAVDLKSGRYLALKIFNNIPKSEVRHYLPEMVDVVSNCKKFLNEKSIFCHYLLCL